MSNPMAELRLQALRADAVEYGMEPSDELPNVFGVVMDMAFPNGTATLVTFAEGTTSLYTSTGSGIIGGGGYQQVVQAAHTLLRTAEEHLDAFAPDTSVEPPAAGSVTIRVLTHKGRLAVTEDNNVLGEGHSPASPVFHAAHGVLTELRQIDEAQS
ncbi:MAG TPA: hypothetical protein VG795_14005 [Acidimicrobiia bacterium]|nr:hypothetical protein [Acidimicrobiia bacterium]